jgi:hypothetical protein
VSRAAVAPAPCYQGTFRGRADQVQVRSNVAEHLDNCPADGVTLVVSEFAANAGERRS